MLTTVLAARKTKGKVLHFSKALQFVTCLHICILYNIFTETLKEFSMTKMRPKEVKLFVQGHTACRRQGLKTSLLVNVVVYLQSATVPSNPKGHEDVIKTLSVTSENGPELTLLVLSRSCVQS